MKERVKQIKQQMRQLSSEMAPAQKQLKWLRAELKALAKAGAAVLVLGMMALVAMGADAVAAPTTTGSPWWADILAASGAVVAGVLAWLGRMLAAKLKFNQAQADMMDALAAGVAKTYDDYVRSWKAANSGKLTPDQKKLAKDTAIANALAVAKGPAKDLMLSYGKEHLGAWIEQIITKAKGGTNEQLASAAKVP